MANILGTYMAQKREEKGWSQRELARKADVSFTAIQSIERGDTKSPGIEVLLNVSKALNVPIMNFILAYQDKDPDNQPPKEDASTYRDALKTFFQSLPREDQLEIMAVDKEELRKEARKLDEKEKKK